MVFCSLLVLGLYELLKKIDNDMGKVISIISGKGGCGKSLLTAFIGKELARIGAKIIIVDIDIFVRGLTVLIENYKRERNVKSDRITTSAILGIYEMESERKKPIEVVLNNLCIYKLFDCDVLVAVDTIQKSLDYNDKDISDEMFCKQVIENLLFELKKKYEYIFLDNRAGLDSLVIASCESSDCVLCVAEDDLVGRQTALNVIGYLEQKKGIENINSIINKCRSINNIKDIEKRLNETHEYKVIGYIPFDIEILENFGNNVFWEMTVESLYFRTVIESWNRFAEKHKLLMMDISMYIKPPKIFMSKHQGHYGFIERVLRFYSITFIVAGILLWVYFIFYYGLFTVTDISVLIIILGSLFLIFSTSNTRKMFYKVKDVINGFNK